MGTKGDIAAGVSRSQCVAESWLLPIYIARRLSRMSHTHGVPFPRLRMLQFASSKEYKIVTRYTSTHGAGFIACDVLFFFANSFSSAYIQHCNKTYADKTLGWGKQ